jgi:nucleoside-diphosphate-sugar epimerase
MNQKASFIVTGSTGFIGGYFVKYLVDNGYRVIAPLRKQSMRTSDSCVTYVDSARIDEMSRAFQDATAVFHLATHFVGTHSTGDVEPLIEANVALTARVLEAAHLAQVRNVVYTESSVQHIEGRVFSPSTLYGATKQCGSVLAQTYAHFGHTVVCLTVPDTLGAGDNRGKLISALRQAYKTCSELQMSPGNQLVDYLHVSDVCSGLLKAFELCESLQSGTIEFARLSGTTLPLIDFVKQVEDVLDGPLNINWGARPYRSGEMFDSWNWPPLLHGWKAIVPLRAAIEDALSI